MTLLEVDGDNSCATMSVHLMPQRYTLKNGSNDEFLLCIFYHNNEM